VNAARLSVLTALLLAALILSVSIGAASLPLQTVVDVLRGGGDPTARAIVMELRLPRSVLACLVGAGLALGGAVFQALLRNPLADPYILGVSSGAAVAAVGAITLGVALDSEWTLPLA
jgi:iron complex transport system permease protein